MKREILIERGALYATPASARDVLHVACRLREEDERDIAALLPGKIREAVVMTAYGALWCAAVRRKADDMTVAILGLGRGNEPDMGIPWLLSTSEMFDHPAALARCTRWFLARMHRSFSVLVNWTDMRNLRTLRWLRWAGATVLDPEPFGVYGLPFHRFEFRREYEH